MQFIRNTRVSRFRNSLMLIIKILLVFVSLIFIVILLSKIDFPSPNNEMQKIIPNENLKIVK
jgi:hypothetical protein